LPRTTYSKEQTVKRHSRIRHLFGAAIVAAGAIAGPLAPAIDAHAEGPDLTKIQVPAGNKQFLAAHATGVQIYSCNATGTSFNWVLLAPRANLYDGKGRIVATHFGGPTWKANDGSSVVGKKVDGVTVDPTAIQWLLIAGDSWTVGADGDRLANTTFVQRLRTTGGLAPRRETCTATSAGNIEEVAYTADYTFWKKTGA
jgi:hypothetical protein